MANSKTVIQFPKDKMDKIVSIEPYIASMDKWMLYKVRSEGLIRRLDKSTKGGAYYFDDRHLPAWHPNDKLYHMKHNPAVCFETHLTSSNT